MLRFPGFKFIKCLLYFLVISYPSNFVEISLEIYGENVYKKDEQITYLNANEVKETEELSRITSVHHVPVMNE